MPRGRAYARLQLLLALLLALVCLVHGHLESRRPPADNKMRRKQRRQRRRKRHRLYNINRGWKRVHGRRVGVIDDFDFQAFKKWCPKKNRAMAALRSDIALVLPNTVGDGDMNKTGIVTYSYRVLPNVVRIFGYVQDETKEEMSRRENATFTLYLNETSNDLQGNVRLYDRLFSYRTKSGAVTVTEMSLGEGMCDFPSSMTGRTSLLPGSQRVLHDGHSHDEGAETHGHRHRPLWRQHHANHLARMLSTGTSPRPFLIFIDFNVTEGPNPQWGDVTDLVSCSDSFFTPERIKGIVEEVSEDFAPFDVEVTTDRAVYDAWNYNRVRANVIDKVTLSGKPMSSCGLALINTYSQADNCVWASCACGGPKATAGTISHEVGHTFGLTHDGDVTRPVGKLTNEYLFGLPRFDRFQGWPNSRRWNTIMGGANVAGVRQWNPGSYQGASNPNQDDVAMLRTAIGERSGIKCNQTFPMRDLSDGNAFTFPESAIICAAGVDSYHVKMSSGPCKIEVTTPEASNLKFRISLFAVGENMEATGSAIHEVESNPYLSQKTELQLTLQIDGHYVITIASIEQKTSDAANGYEFPVYGSMGFYVLMVNPTGEGEMDALTLGSAHLPGSNDQLLHQAQSCYTWPSYGLQTIFTDQDDTPEATGVTEGQPIVLGVRFKVTTPGTVQAVRFYKSPDEGGNHVGRIYDWDSQQLLASTTDGAVVDDSACPGPGWITIDLPTPLAVKPGREYVVALDSLMYHVRTEDQLANGWSSGNLQVVESGAVFTSEEGSMPTDTWLGSTNFWVDAVFASEASTTEAESRSPLATPYVPPTDVICQSWPINGYQTIFTPADQPQDLDLKVELDSPLVIGLRFQTAKEGYITAVRFYKAQSESGEGHEGRIYDWESGELLARTITGVDDIECTGPGWVSIPLQVPFYTSPDTEYVVALDGVVYYTKSSDVLLEAYTTGDLMVMGEGGVYGQTPGEMPAETWLGSSHYWVDVEFARDLSLPSYGSLNPASTGVATKVLASKPTPAPITEPTPAPTYHPTPAPTYRLTPAPTHHPTTAPSRQPTRGPTSALTKNPTRQPTNAPSRQPTHKPTNAPSKQPTRQPTEAPTNAPTKQPTHKPTNAPSKQPTRQPTKAPTNAPTTQPTHKPTNAPLKQPTRQPTKAPTNAPTKQPTHKPTNAPSKQPTRQPTKAPTTAPAKQPTHKPTNAPSKQPTRQPTKAPTTAPAKQPTHKPTPVPSRQPTRKPTTLPTKQPTHKPTITPTKQPTHKPTKSPTKKPTPKPVSQEPSPEWKPGRRVGQKRRKEARGW